MRVKVFDCEHENDLTKELNDFIKDIENDDMEVVDIKYSTSVCGDCDDTIFCFSALVMYKPMIKFDCDVQLWDEMPETMKASCIVKEEN